MRRYLSIAQAAEAVSLSEKTIRRAIATKGEHHLRAAKIRGQWRIAVDDLDAWVRSYTV